MTSEFESGLESRVGAECESKLGESSAARPLISSADSPVTDGDTGKTINGDAFGYAQGAAKLELADADTYSDSNTFEEQTITSWGDDQIEYTVSQGSLTPGSVYAYIQSDTGHRSDGHEVTLETAAGTIYIAGQDGVHVLDEDTNTWSELGNTSAKDCIAIHEGDLYAAGGGDDVLVYDTGSDSWSLAATTNLFNEDLITLFSLGGTLYGVHDNGNLYEIDLSSQSLTQIAVPDSAPSSPILTVPVSGGLAYIVGDFTEYGGVTAARGVSFDGTDFSALEDASREIGTQLHYCFIGPSGSLEGPIVQEKSGFPVERGLGEWGGSSWSYLGDTEGNYGTSHQFLAYYSGYYNDMAGRRTTGDLPFISPSDGFYVDGANVNRVKHNSAGIYAALTQADSVNNTSVLKYDDYGSRTGSALGSTRAAETNDLIIDIDIFA